MENFLEAFYYGRLDPQKRKYEEGDRVILLSNRIHEIEKQLIERYSGEERDVIFEFIDSHCELKAEIEKDSFISGFRLGARLAYDVLDSSDLYINKIFDD